MTRPSFSTTCSRIPGSVRTVLALAAMLASFALGTGAAAGGGGIGTGGGDEGSDGSGERTADRYEREWDSFSLKDKRWARRTSECEANQDPDIHDGSGTYHGAFQFVKSTWRTSPMSPDGDPHTYRWKTQAVVAVKLKHRDGAGHWPVCG